MIPDKHAVNRTIVIVFANKDYLPVVDNWIVAVRKLGITGFLVIAMDNETHLSLQSRGIPVLLRQCERGLNEIWVHRIHVLRDLLRTGVNILHSDADAVWLKNPLDRYFNNPSADMIFSAGTIYPDNVHEKWKFVLCCGFYYMKSSPAVMDFIEDVVAMVGKTGDDQLSINRLLCETSTVWDIRNSYELEFRGKKFLCSREIIHGSNRKYGLDIDVLPHREFQRIAENHNEIYVKHIYSDKNAASIMEVLAENGCLAGG